MGLKPDSVGLKREKNWPQSKKRRNFMFLRGGFRYYFFEGLKASSGA
jgi:hypothetical protein